MHKFLALCLLFISFSGFGQARRAQSLIEKQKYETAFVLLSNGLVKDSTSASIPFVLAKLYLVKAWPKHQLDSAHYFSVRSLQKYDLLGEKHLDRHVKDGFGKTRLLSLKNHIDSLAFEIAKEGGTERDFQHFIDQHTTANSLDSAIYYRDAQAYLTAEQKNSLSSYKYFIGTYPNAVDWQKADAHYQQILYAEHTLRGKLSEYKNFVASYPQSPFYEEAVAAIYSIEIGQNTTQAILSFINNYPNSKAAQKGIGLLYHAHLEEDLALSFADKFPTLSISDSLASAIKNQHKTWMPIGSGGLFKMVDLNQETIVDSLQSIDINTIDKDFISAKTDHLQLLFAKSGQSFYQHPSFTYLNDSLGYLFLKQEGEIKVIHKNGTVIDGGTSAYFAGPFIAFKSNEHRGLTSITNRLVLAPNYDSIWVENNLLLLTKKGKTTIHTPASLYPALDQNKVEAGPFYDDYEWLSEELLWVEKGGKEGLFSSTLTSLVPLGNYQIDVVKKGWSVQKNTISVPMFFEELLLTFNENEYWQIGQLKDSVIVKYRYGQLFTPTSASLLGPFAIMMHWTDSSFVYLSDTIRFFKPKKCEVKPLFSLNNKVDYYEVIDGKHKTIMNNQGQKLDLPKFSKIISLNQSFFQLKTDKSSQLYTRNGDLILKNFDGASLINDSTVSILKNQQFGVIQPIDSVYIAPLYDRRLQPLADSLWVASWEGKLGLINSKADTLLPFRFDEINYWTNGLLMVKQDFKWHIYDLKNSKFVELGIVSFTSITKNGRPKITFQKGAGIGVFESEKGTILKPTFTAVAYEGTASESYYRAKKHVEEAGLHIMLYYNMDGKLLFQNILNEAQFEVLYGVVE